MTPGLHCLQDETHERNRNLLQTIKSTVQDIVAPDVRGLKAEMVALGKCMDSLEDQIKVQFDAFERQSDAQFWAIMAAIQQSRAETELLVYKQISTLSERVTIFEARQQ